LIGNKKRSVSNVSQGHFLFMPNNVIRASFGDPPAKTFVAPRDAAARFLRDMAEVSGYAVKAWSAGQHLSPYATYRPILTAPDPWYFAGIVALEATKICDLFAQDEADETLREVFAQMDGVAGRDDNAVSKLAFVIMGRVGKGTLLMQRKVPDYLLAKVMMILLGSPSAAAPHMPEPGAHEQIRAALKLGRPVWWMMFNRRFQLKEAAPSAPRLIPSAYAEDKTTLQAAE
jgi:hypothetical protein